MKISDYPSPAAEKKIEAIARRQIGGGARLERQVARILADVQNRGDRALIEYVNRFDAPDLTMEAVTVRPEEVQAARSTVSRSFVRALNRAKAQIEAFHQYQKPKSWMTLDRSGALLGQRVCPVDRVGVYVPGGRSGLTPRVSSLLMGAIPAKIAGVEWICMVTPPMQNGKLDPHLLVAAAKVGVDAVYKLGSAWAIGALAYGTETIPRVDVIVGPGNQYVTMAKKIVSGTVGIDIIAGPSEILVIADQTANPEFIAADLLSQAEHDAMASAILVTDSRKLAAAVNEALSAQLRTLSRREIAEAALSRYGAVFLVPDMAAAVSVANRIAPEHLELQVAQPFDLIDAVRHAGAVFVGPYTPEPVGDYIAGPNHVLPTSGTARFASALSVDHFVKKTSVIRYSAAALEREAKDIACLARIEGLEAHARAVEIRLKKK